jgi:hypothetical protein
MSRQEERLAAFERQGTRDQAAGRNLWKPWREKEAQMALVRRIDFWRHVAHDEMRLGLTWIG